jgi:OmpA-OmpF porin, OOP family
MKKNTFVASLFFLVAGIAYLVPAAAQMQQSPWYVGLTFGQSRARDICSDASLFGAAAGPCDHKDVAWRILGGYQINRYFAAELGYHDLGKGSIPGTAIESNAWELVGVGMFPVGQSFSLYGKFGGTRSQSKCQGAGCVPANLKETSTNVTWGGGLQFDLARNVAIRGEWQRYNNMGGGQFNAKYDVDTYSLGGLYRF